MGFPRQEYWSGLPWRSISFSKGFSQPRIKLGSPALTDGLFTIGSTREAQVELYRLIYKLCFPLEKWTHWCLWSRGVTPPASGFYRIPLRLLCGVFVKCSVKASGIGPCTLLLVFLKDVPSWWISMLTYNSNPHWTELSHILQHESPPTRKLSLRLFHPGIPWRWTKKGRNLLFPLCLPTSQ